MNLLNKGSITLFLLSIILLVLALWDILPILIVYAAAIIGIGLGVLSLLKGNERRYIGLSLNIAFVLILIGWTYIPPYLFSG